MATIGTWFYTKATAQFAAAFEESPQIAKAGPEKAAFGVGAVRGLRAMVADGWITPFGEEPPVQVLVSDLRWSPKDAEDWTNLPTQDDLAYDWGVALLPDGEVDVEVRDRDTADNAASDWVRLTLPIAHEVVEEPEPPPPPPPGTFFWLDGRAYKVIADEPVRTPAAALTGEVFRAYSGRLMTRFGAAEGGTMAPAGTWSGTLWDLTAAERADLYASLANRRRAIADGIWFDSTSTAVTGTIEEATVRVWRRGVESFRVRYRIALEAVEGAD